MPLDLDWSPDALFTEEHARFVMLRGACMRALLYVGRAVDAYAKAEPRAALHYAADKLTPARLDACANARPGAALRYAADKITPARLDACAEAEPRAALEYAPHLLTPERLAWCRRVTTGG